MSWTFDPATSKLELWTYKEGLLSGVAHDLCFRAEALSLVVGAGADDAVTVEARIPVEQLALRGQVKRGSVKPMKPKDAADIKKNMLGPRVLEAAAHPQVVFRGEGTPAGGSLALAGELTLRGVTCPLTVTSGWLPVDGGVEATGEAVIQPSVWGIAPYTALMGALRVRDEVRLTWSLRLSGS